MKQAIAARIAQLWPGSGEAVTPAKIGEGAGIEGVQQALLTLTPKTDAQRWLQSTALQTTNTIAARRWLIAQQIASNLRWPFLVVLIFWLAVIFASFGLFAPRNTIMVAALFVAALFGRRLDLSHPRDGPALWRVHQDQKRSAAFGPGAARPALSDGLASY